MANFCPKCGGKVNPDDKFCKNCGATLIGSVEVLKEELRPEKPPIPVQVQVSSKPPSWPQTVSNILGVLVGLGIVFLVLYSLGCAMGMFPNTEDRMCQSIHQAFSGGGGTSGGGGGTSGGGGTKIPARQYCSPGYCLSNGYCCPSNARYYCEGKCYYSSQDAMSASQGRCTSFKIYCD